MNKLTRPLASLVLFALTAAPLAAQTSFDGDVDVQGNLRVRGSILPDVPRSSLRQESLVSYGIPFTSFRIYNAFQTTLPGTSSGSDLALTAGTFGTGTPYITTGDVKATSATRYARTTFCLPAEYVPGGNVVLRISGGMKTTIADTSATVDVEVYKLARDGTVSGSDLVTTAAQSINSLTFADKDFVITSTSLSPGDWVDIRITVATVDAATGTAVTAAIGAVEARLDIKG